MKENPVSNGLGMKPSENTVDSASDERTVNNATRRTYRELSDEEKADMVAIKDMGAELIAKLHSMDMSRDCALTDSVPLDDRNLELARRHIEDGVMRAVRFITA